MPAVGDLDGDGKPEIIVKGSGPIYCFNNDGTLKWTSPSVAYESHPVIADLDGDGKAEIITGTAVLNFDGTLRWDNANSSPYPGGASGARQVVDLDLDGVPEIVAGASAVDK